MEAINDCVKGIEGINNIDEHQDIWDIRRLSHQHDTTNRDLKEPMQTSPAPMV